MLWSDRSWVEWPADLEIAKSAAILPVGAVEQHGPHMGCGMDFVLADRLCRAVAEATRVPMMPALPYGCSLGHSKRWPGTIALGPRTLIDLVQQVGQWAHALGLRRLFIVNCHVTDAAPLRCALELLRAEFDDLMVALINSATMGERVRAAHFADAEDWHANEAETSLMLHTAPELVRPDRLASADDADRTSGLVFSHPVNRTSQNGVTGRPSTATTEAGARLFAWMPADNEFQGKPYPLNTRVALKNVIAQANAIGFGFNLGVECEIILLRQNANGSLSVPHAGDKLTKPCYDVQGFVDNFPWLDKMAMAINDLGWDLYSFHHEDANGQFEFDFNYAGALTTCDRLTSFRFMAKHYAKEEGVIATMMPKPFADKTGNGAYCCPRPCRRRLSPSPPTPW